MSCFRGVHAGLFHPVKGFSTGVLNLVFQRVSGFAHTLGYNAWALIQVFLDAVAVLANPLVLEVGCSECSRNRRPDRKTYGAKHERLSFKQIRRAFYLLPENPEQSWDVIAVATTDAIKVVR